MGKVLSFTGGHALSAAHIAHLAAAIDPNSGVCETKGCENCRELGHKLCTECLDRANREYYKG